MNKILSDKLSESGSKLLPYECFHRDLYSYFRDKDIQIMTAYMGYDVGHAKQIFWIQWLDCGTGLSNNEFDSMVEEMAQIYGMRVTAEKWCNFENAHSTFFLVDDDGCGAWADVEIGIIGWDDEVKATDMSYARLSM